MRRFIIMHTVLLCSAVWVGASEDKVYDAFDEKLHNFEIQRASIRSAYSGFNEPVVVKVIIDRQGNVESVHAFGGPRGAFQEAERAEKLLKFKPVLRNGRPVRASFEDHVNIYPLERWSDPRVPFPPIEDRSTVSLRMERRAFCFEPRCMCYTVEIDANRRVEVVESRFCYLHPQQFRGTISQQNFKELIEEFRRADFFSMRGSYVADLTDGQGALLTIGFDRRRKTVAEYDGILVGAPDVLRHLEDRFDELAGTSKWVKKHY